MIAILQTTQGRGGHLAVSVFDFVLRRVVMQLQDLERIEVDEAEVVLQQAICGRHDHELGTTNS